MDMESIFNHLVKEREPYYQHTLEGNDDMPAHAKSSIIGTSVTIPITNGKLNLGTGKVSISVNFGIIVVIDEWWLPLVENSK